jgi:hypothetical protein
MSIKTSTRIIEVNGHLKATRTAKHRSHQMNDRGTMPHQMSSLKPGSRPGSLLPS